ncbi:MAG TPA: hypothetical protein VD902_02305, partial [Symbiobacteriaceae bacterium]|nr:hypothetical protein [Symbiobacteriaceae bacterium]
AGLLEDLAGLHNRLGVKLDAYKGAVQSPRQILLYDPAELDDIYERYVKHGQIAAISQDFQEKRGINLLDYSVGEYADLRADELMEYARERFRGIDKDFVAIDMFYQRFGNPQNRTTALDNLLRASQVWVKWAADTSVGPQLQPQQQRYVVAFSDPNGQRTQAFRQEVTQARGPGQATPDFFVIDSPHEIIFYAETGGFALSRLDASRFMKEAYQSHRDRSVPLHIDRPESRFPDVMLTNPRELQDLREATDLYHTTRAMNALEALTVAGVDNAVSYRFHHYVSAALGTRAITLGENDRAIDMLRRDADLRRALRNRLMALRQVIYGDRFLLLGYAALCRWYATAVYGPEDVEGSRWTPRECQFYEREATGAVAELTRNGEFDRHEYEALAQTVATPGDKVSQELPDGFRVLRWTPPAPADLG